MKKSTIGWLALGVSMIVAYSWDSANAAWIKSGIHSILDPTAGALLDWNLTIGI